MYLSTHTKHKSSGFMMSSIVQKNTIMFRTKTLCHTWWLTKATGIFRSNKNSVTARWKGKKSAGGIRAAFDLSQET